MRNSGAKTGAGFTPGEWTVKRSLSKVDGAYDYAISAGSERIIAEAFGRSANAGWPNAEANAHLIAAAPAQNAALIEASNALDACEDYFDNRSDADCDQDGFIPNEEMKLLSIVSTALAQVNAALSLTEGK